MARLIILNPSDRCDHQSKWSRHYAKPRFVLWFGACAPTYIMVWGHIEEALELCADWLADNAPGHIMLMGNGNDERDPELDSLMAEACEERGLAWPIPDDCDDMQPYWDAEQDAYTDLTTTERGYIPSHEWGIALDEHATRDEVKAFIRELDDRNFGDEPTVKVA